MLRATAIVILLACSGFMMTSDDANMRAKLLKFAHDNSPTAKAVLAQVPQYDFERFVEGSTDDDLLKRFGTCVHESKHMQCSYMEDAYEESIGEWGPYQAYIIDDSIRIMTKRTKVYNSHRLNKFVPDSCQKAIFRYPDYVGNGILKGWCTAHVYGVFGMLDEQSAYYHGTKSYMELYDYFKAERCNGYENAIEWAKYLQKISQTHHAYYEFKLFMSWYLQYAKIEFPHVYDDLMKNTNLRVAFTIQDDRFAALIDDYYKLVNDIPKQVNETHGEEIMVWKYREFGRVGMSMYVRNDHSGYNIYSLFDNETKYLKKLLENPEHAVLDEFRIPGVTASNYRDFLDPELTF